MPPPTNRSTLGTLSWALEDFEQRLGFRGGRFMSVNNRLTFLLAIAWTVLFYAFVHLVKRLGVGPLFTDMFLLRGCIPYATMLFFFWGLAILFIKARKLPLQRRALNMAAVPQQPDFILNEDSARMVLERINSLVDHPRYFVLFNRIERALSNLHNIGQIGDVSTILRSQAESDEDQVASSYTLLSGLLWGIPVLGFIGTVLGLSQAMGQFGITLQKTSDLSAITTSLKGVSGGLSTAFETTLIALICALVLQMIMTFIQQKETGFLDECSDYCQSHVVSKLKLAERARAEAR